MLCPGTTTLIIHAPRLDTLLSTSFLVLGLGYVRPRDGGLHRTPAHQDDLLLVGRGPQVALRAGPRPAGRSAREGGVTRPARAARAASRGLPPPRAPVAGDMRGPGERGRTDNSVLAVCRYLGVSGAAGRSSVGREEKLDQRLQCTRLALVPALTLTRGLIPSSLVKRGETARH